MSFRAKTRLGSPDRFDRWMVEVFYRDGRPTRIFVVEELEQIDKIIEHGPDWGLIEHILITLNRPAIEPMAGAI